MKKFLILTIFLLILNTLYSQGRLNSSLILSDSVVISHRHFVAATEAFIQLRNLKKVNYVCDERIRNKDITIQYYESLYTKCNKSDSITSVLLVNKDKEIVIKDNLLSDYRFQLNKQKAKTIGLSIGLPLGIGLSFVGGFFIAKEIFQ